MSLPQKKYFQQTPPSITDSNRFLEDHTLLKALRHTVPKEVLDEISKDLTQFAERINNEIEELNQNACHPSKHPYLITYDGID
jgi:hypothetical protein